MKRSEWRDEDDELPWPQPCEEFTGDVWSRAAQDAPAVAATPAETPVEPPLEMFDAEMSLRFWSSNDEAWDYWEKHRDEFPRISDVLKRIDVPAANALEQELEDRARREREAALERIRSAPRHSGRREDADLLHHLVKIKPQVLSFRRNQVYQLCLQRGFSVHRCAQALGIGHETVRTHLRRLRSAVPAAWRARDSK